MSTHKGNGETIVVSDECDFCDACVAVCPPNCLSVSESDWRIEMEDCVMCLQCVVICPVGALAVQAS